METFSSKSSHVRSETTWPDIDVVIPTLNCERNLEMCLNRLRSQNYNGKLNIIIVDGGSKDETIKVAERYSCIVKVIPGIYLNGKNGAKMVGELMGHSEFIWHVDSDNFIVGTHAAENLVKALIDNPDCNIAVPVNYPKRTYNKKHSKFSRYLNEFINQIETDKIRNMCNRGKKNGNNYIVKDMDVGITNASMIRRSAEEAVGFYDSDVEMLKRLRKRGLADGVVVADTFFEQAAISTFMGYVFKNVRRVKFFAKKASNSFTDFFVEPENIGGHFSVDPLLQSINLYLGEMIKALKSRKKENFYFIASLVANILILLYSLPSVLRILLRTRFMHK